MINRRRILRMIPSPTICAIAGCVGDSEDGPAGSDNDWVAVVTASEPDLRPGEEVHISVEAEPITGMEILPQDIRVQGDDPRFGPVKLDLYEAQLDPPPSSSLDDFPPVWHWESQTSVSMETTARADAEAEPGEYTYGVRVIEGGEQPQDGDRETFEFVMTVIDD